MTKDEIIRLGDGARRALDDDAIMAALAEIEAEQTAAWASSGPDQSAQREDAYRMHRCVGLIKMKLAAYAGNAELEKSRLEASKLYFQRIGAQT